MSVVVQEGAYGGVDDSAGGDAHHHVGEALQLDAATRATCGGLRGGGRVTLRCSREDVGCVERDEALKRLVDGGAVAGGE